jgi:hypothetical protein
MFICSLKETLIHVKRARLPCSTRDSFSMGHQRVPCSTRDSFSMGHQRVPCNTRDSFSMGHQRVPCSTRDSFSMGHQSPPRQRQLHRADGPNICHTQTLAGMPAASEQTTSSRIISSTRCPPQSESYQVLGARLSLNHIKYSMPASV